MPSLRKTVHNGPKKPSFLQSYLPQASPNDDPNKLRARGNLRRNQQNIRNDKTGRVENVRHSHQENVLGIKKTTANLPGIVRTRRDFAWMDIPFLVTKPSIDNQRLLF